MKLSDYIAAARENKNLGMQKIRIAILRSFSCETMESILKVKLNEVNFGCEIFFGGFNSFMGECLEQNSALYEFNADFIVFNIRYDDFNADINEIKACVSALKDRVSAAILINGFVKPYYAPENIYEAQGTENINNRIRKINLQLAQMCESFENVYMIDTEEILLRLGRETAYDIRMWEVAKNPYTLAFYEAYSSEIVKYICAVFGIRKKCIILDLDNTLWQGIIGEDGFDKITVNKEFQKLLLYLKKSGVLLAVCSRNNPEDALLVFEKHPDMVLKKEDFVLMYINWEDKAKNISEISKKLNIGLDSLLFIDDSEAECELVRLKLPEVTVLCLPKKSYEYVAALRKVKLLDYLTLTREDTEKTGLLQTEIKREELREALPYADYLKYLGITVIINEVDAYTISRVAQLTQKTNQYNFTTKRYTKEILEKMLTSGYKIYYLTFSDKFGDSGITGAAIIDISEKETWLIDSFLLSCRVLNRSVESSFMEFIVKEAYKKGVKKIKGKFIETAKNKPAVGAYESFNFKYTGEFWELAVSEYYELEHFVEILDNNRGRNNA